MHEIDAESEVDISKSQRKRESQALRQLGESLVKLPAKQLDKIPLETDLRDAIDLCRRINSHSARKRQLGFIGKLLRNTEIDDIQTALEKLQQQDRQAVQQFHQLEQLRDQLIEHGDDALHLITDKHPHVDRQHLRQLIRQARKDHSAQKPKGPRALFKFLRALEDE